MSSLTSCPLGIVYHPRRFTGGYHSHVLGVQTKDFENTMAEYYFGDKVPKYFGHYFIPASFHCEGCSILKEIVYVRVWLEIKDRKLITIRTWDPETDESAREILAR